MANTNAPGMSIRALNSMYRTNTDRLGLVGGRSRSAGPGLDISWRRIMFGLAG